MSALRQHPDGGSRADGVLVLGVFALGGALLAVHPGAGVAMAGAVALAMRRQVGPILLLIGLLAYGVQGARAAGALREVDGAVDAASGLVTAERPTTRTVEVVTTPVVLRPQPGRRAQARVEAKTVPEGHLVRLYGMPKDARRGDRYRVNTVLRARRRFHQVGGADPRIALVLRPFVASGSARRWTRLARGTGLAAAVDRFRAYVRRRIEATYPPKAVPMARALVLGEQALDPRDAQAFRSSGLSHLLAVSGSHLVIAVVALAQLLRAFLVRFPALAGRFDVGRAVAGFTIVASWVYADFAGGGGSAYRAAAMLSAANWARAWGWRAPTERSFGWSMLAAAALQPWALFDVSFTLSLAATGGLLLARTPVARLHRRLRPGPGRWLVTTAAATVAATLACTPVLLTLGPQVPVLGVAANAVAGPIGELVALPLSLVHCVAGAWPALERGIAATAGGSLLAVRAVAHGTATSPWATASLPPPTLAQLCVLVLGGICAWASPREGRRRAAALVAAVVCAALEMYASIPPRGELRVTVLDVGQGDAMFVDLPDGRLMVVDGGGLVGSPIDIAERVLLPELRRRRRRHVDIVVLSHAHPDHYGGLLTLLRRVEVGELWDPSEARGGSAWHRARADLAARGVPRLGAAELCAVARDYGGAEVRALSPCPGRNREASENDNSVVLHLRYGRHAALLAGDAEAHAEAQLLASGVALRADMLKVGHHGSRTSTTPSFVRAVRPAVAVISRGCRNRFGHPHAATLAHLREVPVMDTGRDGGVAWATDGQEMTVTTARWDSADMGAGRRTLLSHGLEPSSSFPRDNHR
ncbi:MAG: DNA internalization-related competence protein ComEC/Rec2 [Myxococcota bacterium]